MLMVKFTHANHKTEVYVAQALVAAVYYSPNHKSTMLVASGGAVIPVQESVEDVNSRLTLPTTNSLKEGMTNE